MPDFSLILPEVFLAVSALLILMEGSFLKKRSFRRSTHYGLLALGLALFFLIFQNEAGQSWVTFEGQIKQDDFIFFAKALILLGSLGTLAMSVPFMMKENLTSFEYPSLILLATIGMLLMVEANDFIILFVGMEMQGLTLYVLAALHHDHPRVSEAALKYFILGALATGLFLYGVSFMYGFTGATNFDIVASVIRAERVNDLSLSLFVGLVFIMAALAFKVSAVPFHMWTPDVYQGCPTPITAFIGGVPKVAAMVVFLRLMVSPFLMLYAEWQSLMVFISAASMIVGAFAALQQTDLKRLLAYSAIGQMGYALMGISSGNDEGIQSVFVYLTIYLVMFIGTFACLLSLKGKTSEGVQEIEDLKGISQLHPKLSLVLAIFMFSMAGIPPLAGFFAKLYVFKAAISEGLFYLAIIGVLTSVVASYYYLKIVKVIYFDALPDTPKASHGQLLVLSPEIIVVLNICAAIISTFFLFPNGVLDLAQRAALVFPL
ncbi:MAG: NADH-quinone oxidoreductase subunit NuoN [Alphaproteobacteria bacterium]|nr:NADH-quinone oxidoreductase subunit NuoN [Alphaproteobacteria bacterium]